jgi:hypothetical protein
VAISDDGKRVAFLGNDGGRQIIGLDDRDISGYVDRDPSFPLTLSADGSTVAYLVLDRTPEGVCVVINGREGRRFDRAGRPAMSRDGRVVAHWASRNDEYFVRIGDLEGPAYEFVTDPAVSADGSTVAYGACREGRWFIRMRDKDHPLTAEPRMVFVSPDGRRVGWVEFRREVDGGSRMRVVAESSAGEFFAIVGMPSFSPVDARVVYGAEDDGRKFVVIGSRKVETPDRVGDPSFSPDGRRVGYGARVGRDLLWKMIKD